MPPKIKITKEQLIDCALELVRTQGVDALNARALTRMLDCSTQPIFSHFNSMESLKQALMQRAYALYTSYLVPRAEDADLPLYKVTGMGYLRFAKNEPMLFRLLFMRQRSQEEQFSIDPETDAVLELITKTTKMTKEEAASFHLEIWIYVHGIASMLATGYLALSERDISNLLSRQYQRMIKERSHE